MELSSEQHDFGTVTVPFASYGHHGPVGRRAVGVAAVGSVRTDVLPDRLVITYIYLDVYVVDNTVFLFFFLLLFTFNLGAYSTMVRTTKYQDMAML